MTILHKATRPGLTCNVIQNMFYIEQIVTMLTVFSQPVDKQAHEEW